MSKERINKKSREMVECKEKKKKRDEAEHSEL